MRRVHISSKKVKPVSVSDDERLFYDLLGEFIAGVPKGDIRDSLLKGRHRLGVLLRSRAERRKAEAAKLAEELAQIDWKD